MARYPKTGDLFFSWYDCRADDSNQNARYFGSIITSKDLERLIKENNAIAVTSTIHSIKAKSAANSINKRLRQKDEKK